MFPVLSVAAHGGVRRIAIAASLSCVSTAVAAQEVANQGMVDSALPLPPVVVSATLSPTPSDRIGNSVSVVTDEDIERNQWRNLPDALRAMPGLNLVQTGGPGGTTSVFMRGTNANHTKVLIDGIEVSDPSSADGAFDFSQLMIGDVERIEVLRGPQSGLYGSDAVGGVIDIVTKKGQGPARLTGNVEGGSFETFNQSVGLSGGTTRYHYAFGVQHMRTGDTPVTPANLLPPGRSVLGDDYENTSYDARIGVDLSKMVGIGLTARYIDSELRYTGDDYSVFPFAPNAQRSELVQTQLYTRGVLRLDLFDGVFSNEIGVGYAESQRDYVDPGPAYSAFDGDRIKIDWRGRIALADGHTLLLGLEDETESLNDSPISADLNNLAAFATYQLELGDRFATAVSLRHDDNERFGGATTWRFAPSYRLPSTETRLKGSYGTGYKAPSLTQLFVDYPRLGFFANPDLQPEESRGYDIGFEQPLLGDRVQVGVTYFHNDIDDLIDSTATTYVNIGSATTEGFESFIAWQVDERLRLRADHTFTIAKDKSTEAALLRRPKHKASLSATWDATRKLTLASSVVYVSGAGDVDRYGVPGVRSDSYTLINVGASYALIDTVALYGRVENLLDRDYESPTGFERPGLGAFLGLKVDFQLEDQ